MTQGKLWRLVGLSVLALMIFWVDLILPLGVAGGVPYVAFVMLSWWITDRKSGIFLIAGIATLLTMGGYLFSSEAGIYWMVLANRFLAFFTIWATAILVWLAKRAEIRLRESEVRLRQYMDSSADFITLIDKDYNIRDVDIKTIQMLGLDCKEKVVGRNFLDLSIEMKDEKHQEIFRKILLGELPLFREETKVITPEGEKWLSLKVFPVGTGLGIVSSDITVRKQAEEELRRGEERYRQLVETMTEGLGVVNTAGVLTYVNNNFCEMVGYDREELIGYTTIGRGLLDEANRKIFLDKMKDKSKRENKSYELEYTRKDGSKVATITSPQPMFDQEGVFQGSFAVLTDITKQKQAEKMKEEFISTLSHELRTPLTSIMGSLGIVRGMFEDQLTFEMSEMLEISQRNADQLIVLINDLLDVQKIESGKMEINLKPLNMVDLVDYSISVNRGYANKFNVSIDFQKTLGEIQVEGDWDRLNQVMTNLISNAIKFSPAEKPVEISLQKQGEDKVRITVSDQGKGIPQNFRSRIFQKFSQADSSDTRSKSGTGLGLSICKAIIESHNGAIDYKTKDNQGTEFFFDLPLAS